MESEQFFNDGNWWRRDGAFQLLHDINPLRLRYAAEALGGSLAGRRMLDLGCGGGIFTEAAAREGAQITGCDISPGAIESAKAHAAAENIPVTYRCGGVDMKEAGLYDALTCFEMLEHVDNPADIVADAASMLRPGGVAVFSTINRTLQAWALVIGGLEYALNILPRHTHAHEKFITPAELAKMCEDCGLSVRRITGMDYSFFGRTYLLREGGGAVNYFLTAARQ